jgi:hypothetical protein
MGVYTPPPLPYRLTAQSLVDLGPQYARILSLGKKGASSVIHITPLGHTELGNRLRAADHTNGSE